MNILIVEDEPRAANQLQTMLKACGFSYHLLAIIDTVEDAITWFKLHDSPDLIFLDIQLADGLSFEIFQKVTVEAPIIFTTAFDQYAIQAFKVNSIDYLLKPIQEEDLKAALDQFNTSNIKQAINPQLFEQLLSNLQSPKKREGILVKEGGGFVQLKISDLLYIYSEDSITFGMTAERRYIIDETIDHLYNTLDSHQFFKINRAQLVTKNSITKIAPYFNHRVKLSILKEGDQEFIVSRSKTSEFKAWMNM